MSTTGHPDPDEHRHVRRLLKELPKVEASPDFELRLQRSLNAEKPSPAAAAPRQRFAIPAFAYSLLTLFVVTIVSYYMFFRQAETPIAPPQTAPPERSAPAVAPSRAPKAEEASRSKDVAPAVVPPARSDADKKSSASGAAAPGPVLHDRAVQKPQPPAVEQLEKAKPAEAEPSAPVRENDGVSAPAVTIPKSALKEQQDVNQQIHPEESPVKSLIPTLPPGFKSAAAPSQRSNMFAAPPEVVDTAAHLDSLARDSVRQKDQRRLQDRLQKKKRPIE